MKVSKHIFSLSTVLLVLCLVGFGSCENCEDITNPECKNYDPCWEGEVKASFKILDVLPFSYIYWTDQDFFWEHSDSDTIHSRYVEFEAPEGMDKYTWIIGSEVLHDRVVSRGEFPRNESIPITLIVEKTPNSICFPNDDGIDTLVRNIYYQSGSCNYSKVYGSYKGHFLRNPNEEFIVTYEACKPYTLGDTAYEHPRIAGLFKVCQDVVFTTGSLQSKRFALFQTGTLTQGGGLCGSPMGSFTISGVNDEKVRIELRYINGDNFGTEVPASNDLFIFEGIRQ